MALDFIAGCVGGCAGVAIGYPLDTVKVRMQTQDPKFPLYRGTFHCLYTIAKQESVRGLFKGMSSPLASVAVINAMIFGVYGNVQRRLSDPDSYASHAFAGSVAGFTQSFVSSPMELVKTRIQIQEQMCAGGNQMYKNPLDCTQQIWRSEGVRGIFRGLGITIAREIPAFSIYFASYEAMTRQKDPAQPIGTLHMMMAGGFAGVFSWLFTYPIDLVKSRLQVDGMAGPRSYKGICDCIVQTYRNEGLNGFFRGMPSTLIRSFPVNAVTFSVVTWILRWTEPSPESAVMYQDASQLVHESLQTVAAALAQENQTVDWPYHYENATWLSGWKRLLGGQLVLNFTGVGALPIERNYATFYRGLDWLHVAQHKQQQQHQPVDKFLSESRSCNATTSAAEDGHVSEDGQAATCGSENCTGRHGDVCQSLSHLQPLICRPQVAA